MHHYIMYGGSVQPPHLGCIGCMVRAAEAWGGPCFRAPPHRAGGTEPGASGGPRASSARVRPLASAVGQGLPPPARPPWTAGGFIGTHSTNIFPLGTVPGRAAALPADVDPAGLVPAGCGGPAVGLRGSLPQGRPTPHRLPYPPPPQGRTWEGGAGHGSHTRTVFCSLGPPAAGKATPPPGWPAQNQQTPRLIAAAGRSGAHFSRLWRWSAATRAPVNGRGSLR